MPRHALVVEGSSGGQHRLVSGGSAGGQHAFFSAIADTFTRADSASTMGSTEVGGLAWVPLSPTLASPATWGIIGNKAYCPVSQPSGLVYVATTLSDVTVSADITRGGGDDEGILFRSESGTIPYYLMARFGATNLDLYKRDTAGFTLLGTVAHGLAAGATSNLSVTAVGSGITVYQDWVSVITATETLNQTLTNHGFYCSNSSARFDNFSVTP